MSHQPAQTTTANKAQSALRSLEVVRGCDVGHSYALEQGEMILGNALGGERGIDLQNQEGNTPRRMAGRHATLSHTGEVLTIRDLDSPGGTFVNQQRLLSGQARRLQAGDVIQLGGVQLKVRHDVAAVVPLDRKRPGQWACRRLPKRPARTRRFRRGGASNRRCTDQGTGCRGPITPSRGPADQPISSGRRSPVPQLGRLSGACGPRLAGDAR